MKKREIKKPYVTPRYDVIVIRTEHEFLSNTSKNPDMGVGVEPMEPVEEDLPLF